MSPSLDAKRKGDQDAEHSASAKRQNKKGGYCLYMAGKRHAQHNPGNPDLFELILESDKRIVDVGWMTYFEADEDESEKNRWALPSSRGAYIVLDDGKVKHWGYEYESWDRSVYDRTFLSQIVRICCDTAHAAAVTSDGSVVTWGHNVNNSLGRTLNDETFYPPGKVEEMNGHFVTQVACTDYGVIALTNREELFYCGDGSKNPLHLQGLPSIQQIDAKFEFVCALSTNGEVFAWTDDVVKTSPKLVKGALSRKRVKQLSCGTNYMATVTDDGQVYLVEHAEEPKLIESLKSVKIGSVSLCDDGLMALSEDRSRLFVCNDLEELRVKEICIGTPLSAGRISRMFAFQGVNSFCLFAVVTEPFPSQQEDDSLYLRKLFNDADSHPDVKFTRNNGELVCCAHKCILSTRSSYFKSLFGIPMKESTQMEIPVAYSKEVFLCVIRFIYQTQLDDIKADLLPELFEAADFYCLDGLKEKCCKVLEESITKENVGILLQEFSDKGNKVCKAICMIFLVRNAKTWTSEQKYTSQITSMELWADICKAQADW